MSDIQLFELTNEKVTELTPSEFTNEKALQTLIETYMETFLGIKFLASEYSTGKTHRGRIDSLGLDENSCPVIIEYKFNRNQNVINQGLFYLDWLLDHKAEFNWLVMNKFGKDVVENIEWDGTRLLCIAGDFTKYDQHAVQQIQRNIELIRYKRFGENLLLLELVNAQSVTNFESNQKLSENIEQTKTTTQRKLSQKTFSEQLENAPSDIKQLYNELRSFIFSLGDEVTEKILKQYAAFRKMRNFASVVMTSNKLQLFLKLEHDSIEFDEQFCHDLTGLSGLGNTRVTLKSFEDLERAKPLLERAYFEILKP